MKRSTIAVLFFFVLFAACTADHSSLESNTGSDFSSNGSNGARGNNNSTPSNESQGSNSDPSQWTSMTMQGAPSGRRMHLSAWTGDTGNSATSNRMIIWGGEDQIGTHRLNDGGIYNPADSSWTPVSLINAPTARNWHHTESAIWTGDTGNSATAYRFLVWGGEGITPYIGGMYNPANDTWISIASSGQFTGGEYFQMVWTADTGNPATSDRMIIGPRYGASSISAQIYDPATNTWVTAAPSAAATLVSPGRWHYSAVWTGNTGVSNTEDRMIIWGGATSATSATQTGAIYNPATNTWSTTSLMGAPSARYWNGSVWTGNTGNSATENRMIIWGGLTTPSGSSVFPYNNGAIYNPATDTWSPISSVNAPAARWDFECHWTGSRMLVWAGAGLSTPPDGKWYDPATDTWSDVNSTGNPYLTRYIASIFTGSVFHFWGGQGGNPSSLFRAEGGTFTPH